MTARDSWREELAGQFSPFIRYAVSLSLVVGVTVADAEGQPRIHASERIEVTAENGVPEIPFTLVNNHVLLPVSVNGSQPLTVLLDTGMPGLGLALYDSPNIEGLALDFDPSIPARVRGAGGDGKFISARVAMNETFAFPGLVLEDSRALVLPVPEHFRAYHDGTVGYSLFRRFAVELDYDRKVVRLYKPRSFRPPAGVQVLPITLHRKVPHVTLTMSISAGSPFDAQVVVDLGASHAISLFTEQSEQIFVPGESLTTYLGRGFSGLIEGRIGRIAELELGSVVLKQVLTSFPIAKHQNPRGVDSLAGNLGNDVLRRFKATFDYVGGRLVLEPNGSFSEPFVFDHSGLFFKFGDQLQIERILAGSPASAAGVEIGDVLTHVSGDAVSSKEIGRVRAALRVVGEVSLTLRRGGETLEKVLRLRRLI